MPGAFIYFSNKTYYFQFQEIAFLKMFSDIKQIIEDVYYQQLFLVCLMSVI